MPAPSLCDLRRACIGCLNRQDWAQLGSYVDDEVEHNGRPLKLSGYRNMLVHDFEHIPDLSLNIQILVCDPPRVAARLAAENVFYELKGAEISSVWSVIDKAAVEAQLQRSATPVS